jgi:hypothetical protein
MLRPLVLGARLLLGLGLLASINALAETPAFPARTYTIQITGSSQPIFDALGKAAKEAGLDCLRSESEVPIQCDLKSSGNKPLRGQLDAVDEHDSMEVEIRAYTDTPYPPDDRVDPAIERAILRFFELLSKKDIRHIEQCVGMRARCSELKFH